MPFSNDVYTPPAAATDAFPGKIIASADWNAIFTDIAEALNELASGAVSPQTSSSAAASDIIEFVMDGGGTTLTVGEQGYLIVSGYASISNAALISKQNTTSTVDVWRCTYEQFDAGATHPVGGDSIGTIALAAAVKNKDTGFSDVILNDGDVLAFDLAANNNSQRMTIALAISPITVSWAQQVTPRNSYHWNDIAWSSDLNLFAAVSGSSTGTDVMTSPDGETWTIRTTAGGSWVGITWAHELTLFVAVGSAGANSVMTSPDGINWTLRATPTTTQTWIDVAWSSSLGLLAAVDNSKSTTSAVMTSPNGTAWTLRTIPATMTLNQIVWSPTLGMFAAIASDNTGQDAVTSINGTTWTRQTTPNSGSQTWFDIDWSPALSLFCAISDAQSGSDIMTSSNGTTWTAHTTPNSDATQIWSAVAWSAQKATFAAVATDYTLSSWTMTSADGVTWSTKRSPAQAWWAIAAGDNKFVAVANTPDVGKNAMTSTF